VSSLNNSIRKETAGQKIEIRAQNEIVTETMGLPQAHTKARKIGKACKAILVIWGNRVSDKTFFPRLTVVGSKYSSSTGGQWALAAHDITELELPTAQVDRPVYLKHFVTGYAFYYRDNYVAALAQFKAALNQSVINSVELNEIRVFCGRSHASLSEGQRDMASQLHYAIAYYDTALNFYTEKDFPEQWARAQSSLGYAYINLGSSDQSVLGFVEGVNF
jgi:tetratricopeptide (TPR) repeat protein